MSNNKVLYGLEKLHIAFKGVAQVESIAFLTGCTLDGEVTITVTSAAVTGSPLAIKVPFSTESHSTVTQVAAAVANVLNNNAAVSEDFIARSAAGVLTLTAKVVAADDATLALACTPGTTGVTVGASTNVTAGATGYGIPIPVLGVVGLSADPEGEESKFYADNSIYYTSTSNNGYSGDLETALIPDAILVEAFGWEMDTDGGVVEIADGAQKEFALMGQVQGDVKNRRFVYYDCKLARPKKDHKTTEGSDDPATETAAITMLPIEIGGKKIVKRVLELATANEAVYNAWFTAVQLPTFS